MCENPCFHITNEEKCIGRANYFDGQISDGKTNLRLVGFDTKLQQRLAEFHGRKRQWRFQIAK